MDTNCMLQHETIKLFVSLSKIQWNFLCDDEPDPNITCLLYGFLRAVIITC